MLERVRCVICETMDQWWLMVQCAALSETKHVDFNVKQLQEMSLFFIYKKENIHILLQVYFKVVMFSVTILCPANGAF